MIDELEIIKSMVSDLTGVGVWGFASYCIYLLVKSLVLWVMVFVIAKMLILKVFDYLKADITKDEAETIKREIKDVKSEIERVRKNCELEVKEYKFLYKKLKEANEDE